MVGAPYRSHGQDIARPVASYRISDAWVMDTIFRSRRGFLFAFVLSLAMHVSLFPSWWGKPKPPAPEEPLQLRLMVEPELKPPPSKLRKVKPLKPVGPQALPDTPLFQQPEKVPEPMPAPPAPTSEEWQLASTELASFGLVVLRPHLSLI